MSPIFVAPHQWQAEALDFLLQQNLPTQEIGRFPAHNAVEGHKFRKFRRNALCLADSEDSAVVECSVLGG
jgi:hypothetical protein